MAVIRSALGCSRLGKLTRHRPNNHYVTQKKQKQNKRAESASSVWKWLTPGQQVILIERQYLSPPTQAVGGARGRWGKQQARIHGCTDKGRITWHE